MSHSLLHYLQDLLESTDRDQTHLLDLWTTTLSRTVVNNLKNYGSGTGIIPGITGTFGGDKDLWVLIEFKRVKNPSSLKIAGGTFNDLSKTLKVLVLVPEDLKLSELNKFIPKFKETVRHELEHYRQTQRSRDAGETDPGVHHLTKKASVLAYPSLQASSDSYDPTKARQYFLHPREIEAYVMGSWKEARTRRVPVRDVMTEKLTEIFYALQRKGMSRSDIIPLIKNIQESWEEYAKARFPKLRKGVQ